MEPRRSIFYFLICIFLWHHSPGRAAEAFEAELADLTDSIATAVDNAHLKAVTVADFSDLRGNVSQLGRFLADEVSTGLVMGQKTFTVVDRANLKRIMDEQRLTTSGLVDPAAVKKLGELAGVDAIIIGTVTPLVNSIHVTVKALATDSAKLVGAARGELSKTGSIQQLINGDENAVEPSPKGEPNGQVGAEPSETHRRQKPIPLGTNLTATIDSVRQLDGPLEVYVTFHNAAKDAMAVYIGMMASGPSSGYQCLRGSATDNLGTQYVYSLIEGVTTTPTSTAGAKEYQIFQGRNQYVVVPPQDDAGLRLLFDVYRGGASGKPTSVDLTIELRVLADAKAKQAYDKTLIVRGYALH